MGRLKCIFINLNSIVSRHKRHYFQNFLDEHKPDVVLLAEHKLSPRNKFDLRDFNIFRQDRQNGNGGGTAICLRKSIKGERLFYNISGIEYTAVKVVGQSGRSITFLSLYLRPRYPLLQSDLDNISNNMFSDELVIGCDLNCKHPAWGGTIQNRNGRTLHEWLLTCPTLEIKKTSGPTRISTSESYIDLFLVTPGLVVRNETTGLRTLECNSDHRAVELILDSEELETAQVVERFNFNSIKVRKFNEILEQELSDHKLPIDRIVSISEIDNCVEKMTSAIQVAMEQSIKKHKPFRASLPKLPSVILGFIEERKRLRRQFHRVFDVSQKIELRGIIRNLDKIIQGQISVFENNQYLEKLEKIEINSETFCKVKQLCGIRRNVLIPNLTSETGSVIYNNDSKANLLADNFESIHNNCVCPGIPSNNNIVNRTVEAIKSYDPIYIFTSDIRADGLGHNQENLVSANKVGVKIKRLNTKKSSGFDGIPNFVLKKTDHKTWEFIAVLFNHCINRGYFPKIWKTSKIIPILKPGKDPCSAKSYRPISLLSNVSKLFEYFLNKKINDHIFSEGILKNFQFGFRGRLSTNHALMSLTDHITKGLNKRSPTIAVSLDFEKAFDTAWQSGIIYKMLSQQNFDPRLVRIIVDYLDDRTFKVQSSDSFSSSRTIKAGVPQGSILGPVLYNLFLSDIPIIENQGLMLLYADDIILAYSDARAKTANKKINEHLEILNEYFSKWKLKLNIDKCRAIIFKGVRKKLYPNARTYNPSVGIGSDIIENTSNLKYLGVILNEKMQYYRHVDYALDKGRKAYFAFSRNLTRKGGLSREVKLAIYRQIVRPVMGYAFCIWFGISSHQMERFRTFERRILRYCLNLGPRLTPYGYRTASSREVYDNCRMERIDIFLTRISLNFLKASESIDNSLIRNSYITNEQFDRILATNSYMSPSCLIRLEEKDLLYRNDKLLFYHRGFRTFDLNNTVYNTCQ